MEKKKNEKATEEYGYVPRPKWQVWAARIGFVLMSAFVVYQVLNMLLGWGA